MTITSYDELMNALDGEDFSERPVQIEEFVQSEHFLNLPPLSHDQYTLIRASSQIYKKSTLDSLFHDQPDLAEQRWSETMNEIIFQLGKGSGKDYCASIACAYVVYLLLCLKDPARYYGKPPGDQIAILNIAINAAQAQNTFFKYFKQRITSSPWFQGKYEVKAGEFAFEKNIFVYSGHSEREAWEGYNLIFVILDEISGFALDSASGNENAKTALAVYRMYKQSVTSRFAEFGKVVLLSFPRFKNDFIQQRYNQVVLEKEVIVRTHTFKINNDLPDGEEDNEFTIEWDEDHIVSYEFPKVFAMKRPSWEVNPIMPLESLKIAFYDDPIDSLSRFACMPPDMEGAFFKSREKVEHAFQYTNGVDEFGVFSANLKPDTTKEYFIHVDLARLHDRCAVSMAHVDRWERKQMGVAHITEPAPVVVVDLIRYWTPKAGKAVDFVEVREFIVSLRARGFNVKLTTFDRWESYDMMEYLSSVGMRTDRLSVALAHYTDLQVVIAEERLIGPQNDIIISELLNLRIMPKTGKIDHPRKGGKDLADATCGAVYNAIAHTRRDAMDEVEVLTIEDIRRRVIEESIVIEPKPVIGLQYPIRAPKSTVEVPADLAEYFLNLRVIE